MAADALRTCAGRDITELQRARRHLPMAEPVLRPCSTDWRATSAIARPGAAARRRRNSWRRSTARWPAWRARLPAGARDRAVVALVGIRRAFFPDAPEYQPAHPHLEGHAS